MFGTEKNCQLKLGKKLSVVWFWLYWNGFESRRMCHIYGRCASQIDECYFPHTDIAKCVKTKAVWVGIPSDISKVFPFDIDKYSFEYPFVTGENPFNLCIKWTYPGGREKGFCIAKSQYVQLNNCIMCKHGDAIQNAASKSEFFIC